jgi:hypothetical protein
MATTLDSLRKEIARLEKEHPDSRLLQDYKNQLAGSQDDPGASAAQVWHSGNPVVPASRTRRSASDPMLPAMNGLEQALRRKDAQVMARQDRGPSKAPGSTTAGKKGKR